MRSQEAADMATCNSSDREHSKIVIVDPHPYTAEGLRVLLGTLTDDMEVAATASDPEAALAQFRRHSPDLLIVEPRSPGAMPLIKAVREQSDEVKIIALTSQEDRRQAIEAIHFGAHAYVSKQVEPDDLVCILRVVRSGKAIVPASVVKALVGEPESDPGALTVHDRKLLKLLVDGMDNNQMARNLMVSESTLKRNIHQLLKKLNARNRVEAAARAASNGLLEGL